jgi:hypothetical protein
MNDDTGFFYFWKASQNIKVNVLTTFNQLQAVFTLRSEKQDRRIRCRLVRRILIDML